MDALFSDYEAIRKSGLFDPEYYLASYPDVSERNVDPLVHFLEEGAAEGRNPHPDFDSAFYLEQCRDRGETPSNPLMHYLRIGAARGFKPKPDKTGGRPPATRRRSPVKPAEHQPILVAIEALGVMGAPDGSTNLSVSGWALATAPISEIAVVLDGEVIGAATCGLPRPDVARLYPDRAAAADCGFVLAFDLPGRLSGVIEPMLTVRSADGEAGQRPLRVEIPPRHLTTGIVDPLDEAATAAPGAGKPPLQLCIDNAGVDPSGILRVEGWAVSLVRIEAVEAFVDDALIGKVEFGLARAEVAEAQPDYPNSQFAGFRLQADIGGTGAGRRTIAIRAAAGDGIHGEASVSVEVPRLTAAGHHAPTDQGFHYRCEETTLSAAGRVVLRGWAVCPSPIVAILVLLDDEEVGHAAVGLDRPDIGNRFPGLPHARQPGFSFETSTGKRIVGEHRLTLRFRRVDGKVHDAAIAVAAVAMAPPAALLGNRERRLHLDTPQLVDGAVETPVRGNLTVSGSALARQGVAAIEIAIDGAPLAVADYGLRRLDIKAAFSDWEGALGSGFQALVPHRALPKGRHTLTVTLRDKAGGTESLAFDIEVEGASDEQGPWSLRRKMTPAEIDLDRRILQSRACDPMFVAVLPVGSDPAAQQRVHLTIGSLARQAFTNWRLLAIAPARVRREKLLGGLDAAAGRVDILPTLTLADLASRAVPPNEVFFTVLTPGDELGCDAFLELAVAAALHRDADFLYSDERCVNPASGIVEPYFKPQWSPDLLLSTNYIGRLWCARGDLLGRVAEPGGKLLQHGEYDLVLRCTEAATAIRHVPRVLCERGQDAVDGAFSEAAALGRLQARRGIAGSIHDGIVAGTWHLQRALTRPGLVSIVIPTCAAQGRIETCIETLRRLTHWRDYEIVCVENIPAKDRKWRGWLRRNADRVISTTERFNWSRFNNLAAAAAKGEYLLFLNDDVEIIDPLWLDTLVAEAQRPEIGVVGPLLLYPDRRVQHAGMFLAALGQRRHAFRFGAEEEPGYFGLALTQRNVIAVTGACFMTRRETFDALGGFDEARGIINNDVDYCLRAWQSGLANLYTPHARLVHHEAVSRAALDDEYDVAAFDSKWRHLFVAGDPFFSPHLSKMHDHFTIDDEPTEVSVTGGPQLPRAEIRNILVVKLDHIGDCITAFPAVRRLQQHFPQARIAVLTSRASRPVWAFEPTVAQVIEFDFFHPRSALGEIERTEADWAELTRRLAGGHFDLAVDLRKHIETRPVLRRSGARYLAGFDHHGQFPWLDITLEWDGDHMSMRKRQWVGDDLINLVDAIAAACEDDRAVIALPPARLVARRQQAHAAAAPAIWVHPTSGQDIKQWPVEYFAVVIDQLVEAHGAQIFLTGAPGDEDVAAGIVRRLRHPEAVTSMIGKSPLSELPALLAGAALFLGSDSGLKHIAAGLGIPTVGVHGGTLDPREWGGVGPSAVAIARNVVCSPCYLAKVEDCRRGVACLRQLEPGRVYEACAKLLALSAPTQPAAPAVLPTGAGTLTPGSPQPRPRRSPRPRQPGSP